MVATRKKKAIEGHLGSRRAFLGGLIALLLALWLPDRPAVAQRRARRGPATLDGRIERIDARSWTLFVRRGEHVRQARLTHQTLILAGGRPASRADLRPGQRVRVRFALSRRGRVRSEVVQVEIRPS